ncbi:MAG: hypothetical protein EB060_10895 [Proteobacteria bacterium]|nr:hypothetical protein [Pseudomonadota bacterium]
MKTMTWEEIDKDWGGLQKRHRMEIAQAVARYCVGHSIDEVSRRLSQSRDWVQSRLDFAGICAGVGGPTSQIIGTSRGALEDASRVVKEFAPDIEVKMKGQGGDQTVESVKGKDAAAFQPYLDHYVEQGHEPAAAIRLAKAEWAAEEAVNAGVIKEDVNKQNEKVNRILFPEDAKDTFELDLKMHMARVKAAAKFLDQAKMNFLRRKSTCEMVESANEAWVEQVDRVLTNHPNHR